ncbi:MAG TPA: DUF3843 family protein [Candidatus Paceibacterota bacterium]|nr:DUF3843 family protein [Verrucomicrobiota bacterium]HRY52176.1 DUF3843 family protein [Candidatus Paceibacterota bacterium]
MSGSAKQVFQSLRVPGFTGRGDKYLGEIAQELGRVLRKTQNRFAFPSCRLPEAAWGEWAEDIHNDIGLWRTVEAHQQRCLGTPLPLVVNPDPEVELRGFDPRRLQFLLWTLWPCLKPEVIISPAHEDLIRLAEAASRLLTDRFARLPQDSGVQRFLATPNEYGWDIKRKLLWIGINSYLFRFFFFHDLDDHQGEPDIATKDDFVCQHCTEWSGLGVIDVLAGTLDLPEGDRATLRSWYERHWSFFRVLTRHEEAGEVKYITALNLVNRHPYVIRMDTNQCPFTPGMVIYGALTPWRGEWYWSGEQRLFEDMTEAEESIVRKEMLERSSSIAYRYCPAEAAKALEFTRENHAKFVAYYGGDLTVFPDDLTLAAAEQKRMQAGWQERDAESIARVMREQGLKHPRPRMAFPPEFLKHNQGIAAFANPEEGVENLIHFNQVLSALRKKGAGLTEEESDALRNAMMAEAISPAFVRRLAGEHGAESFAEAFLIRNAPVELALEFLLRRHKGHFYRKRYPSLSLVQDEKQAERD